MSKKTRFRVPFDHEHGKWTQTLFNAERRLVKITDSKKRG